MSGAESRASALPRSRRVDLALAVGVFAALFAATIPLMRVVDPGPWVPGAFGMAGVLLAAGYVGRWFRLSGIVVSIVEIAVWTGLLTLAFGRGTAFLGVVPTGDTFALVSVYVQSAIEDVAFGAAPLASGPALTFLIVASVGLLTIAFDHVVLTARMPLLAGVGMVAISLIPSIAVPGDIDIAGFALLAVSILYLLGVDTRARQRAVAMRAGVEAADDDPTARPRTASGTAVGIGAVAILVALVASPLLPAPLARAGGSGGSLGGATIDPSLELGDDLRQPGATEVLQMRWTGGTPPYLRVATLSHFDGSVWDPDEGETVPVDESAPELDPVTVDSEIEVNQDRTTVEIIDLNSRWAPVPYPAVDVLGLEGQWDLLTDNRTVVAGAGSVRDQSYEAVTSLPEPTLEQIRAREAVAEGDDAYGLPDEMPAVIAQTAAEVTAGTDTDYDALLALQSWFRGTDFAYSLDAPVSDGFDGTGVEAIAEFLDVREGYCVHFASAFAVMARALDMPARIAVGYLPGTSTGSATDGEVVYSVQSTQLHAWPEVHFEGIGWVPFEPTNSLGIATNYASGVVTTPGTLPTPAPGRATSLPTPTPSTTPGLLPDDARDLGTGVSGGAAASGNPWPTIGATLAVVLLLAAPGVWREIRRQRRLTAARRGDAGAAWVSVQELAIDLGLPVPAAETPRAFGTRLVRERGGDPDAMNALVAAIERVSYADEPSPVAGARLADAITAVSSGMLHAVPLHRRVLAHVLPRSLAIRPGSAYAGLLPPAARETTA